MKMSSKRRHSKNDQSSIKYWWIPLKEEQPFGPDNVFTSEDVYPHSNSHRESGKYSETKSSGSRVSTSQLASTVVGIWGCIGEPAVFQTKESFKYGEICQKDNTICYSDSRKHKSTSVDGRVFWDNLFSGNSHSSTAKSNFEDLKAIKRTLCFASCNRDISNCSIWGDSHSTADTGGINKLSKIGVPNDLANKYASIITKPYFGLDDLAKFAGKECQGTDESSITGKKTPPANQSLIQSTESTNSTEVEDSSTGKKMNVVEDMLQPPGSIHSAYSLQPVTCTKDTIIISTSPSSALHSDYNIGVLTSADWPFGQCQKSTYSSCVAVETSAEVSASKDHILHENYKSIIRKLILDEDSFTKHWLSVQDKVQLGFARNKHALAGALAGTLVSLCLHPVDTVKTIIQANGTCQNSSYHILKSVISEKGVLGLYRGIASNIASSAPISAIYTYTYESVKSALLPILPKEYHSFAHCIAGGCSSIATSFIFTPSERIKQQMQVGSQYQNCWNALVGCVEKGGVSSLYAGWGAVLCRNIPHSIIKFYTYEKLKRLLLTSTKSSTRGNTWQTLVCGGIAGSTAALFTTPFDVVKTRLQTQAPGSLARYDGVLHALQEIARQEGLQGLYRGLTPRLAMYVSQGAIFFASYEFLKTVFSLEAPRALPRVTENEENADDPPAPSRLQKLTT